METAAAVQDVSWLLVCCLAECCPCSICRCVCNKAAGYVKRGKACVLVSTP